MINFYDSFQSALNSLYTRGHCFNLISFFFTCWARPIRSQCAVQSNESIKKSKNNVGTAYSGYCFSVDANNEATLRNKTYQTDAVVLFNENQEFVEFGENALNFKMELYKNLMIYAMDGKQVPAIKVFSESLCYLKEHALSTVKANVPDFQVVPQDITWVLIVSAIWKNVAKEFMRQAAKEVSLRNCFPSIIQTNSLLPSTGFIEEHFEGSDELKVQQHPRTRYVVVDCGGGTADITVHEVLEDGSLNELQKASAGSWGGFPVDEKFRNFLRDLFGLVMWHTVGTERIQTPFSFSLFVILQPFKEFISQCKIMCPYESQQATVKGVIMFGTDPKIIRSRVSFMTYGVSVCKPFDPNKHNPNIIRVNKTGGDLYCTGLFQKLVEKSQPVNCDDVSEFIFFPIDFDQTEAYFDFFGTDQFGLTEIKANATDLSSGESGKKLK
uniref:Heat shock 70 kDa protein 12A n=1 Tax=Erpetoichthys calabaricus TaxID=27687 RepID=A0A8C4XF76_ERPCA